MIRRSIGRAMARKAAARESSSASSRVSCESLHRFQAGVERLIPGSGSPKSPCPCGLLGRSFRPGFCCGRWSWGTQAGSGQKAQLWKGERGQAGSSHVCLWTGRDCCIPWGRALIYGICQLSKKSIGLKVQR